jgi:hypothetical protein
VSVSGGSFWRVRRVVSAEATVAGRPGRDMHGIRASGAQAGFAARAPVRRPVSVNRAETSRTGGGAGR